MAYKENDRFGDQVKIQFNVKDGEKTVKKQMFVPLQGQDIELNNLIRTRMGLDTRSVSSDVYFFRKTTRAKEEVN